MGDGFRVRVRAKGWLGFTYYGPKLLKLRLRSGGGFGKKQNRADNQSKSPQFPSFIHGSLAADALAFHQMP